MSKLADQLIASRDARDAARTAFDAHYRAVKADIDERGLGGRIADEAIEQARKMFDEAVAVAEAHPGAVGGTIAALVLWLLRNPIVAWIERALVPAHDHSKEQDRDQDW